MWHNSCLYPVESTLLYISPTCPHLSDMMTSKVIHNISDAVSLGSCREGTITLLVYDMLLLYIQPGRVLAASPAISHFKCMAVIVLHGSLATDLTRSRFTSHLQLAESVSP